MKTHTETQATIAQKLKTTKLGDTLTAGRLKWKVVDLDYDGAIVATPANKLTKFELWSVGLEGVAVIPGLKVVRGKR
jgi:hypothetical protein